MACLNRIVIKVYMDVTEPFPRGSDADSAMMQAAVHAHERIVQGYADSFLFIFHGIDCESAAYDVVARYGFPNLAVVCIESDAQYSNCTDEACEEIADDVKRWLTKYHPGSLPYPGDDGYNILDPWWSGIEAFETDWQWLESFSAALPCTHRCRASTWIEILQTTGGGSWDSWEEAQQFALRTAALCQWLHGFEKVSENSWNDFEATPQLYGLDHGYVAYYAGKESCESSEIEFAECIDAADFASQALTLLVRSRQYGVADELQVFFGNPVFLLAVLWFSIWPSYSSSLQDAVVDLMPADLEITDHFVIMISAWEFVTEGWTDSAYQL